MSNQAENHETTQESQLREWGVPLRAAVCEVCNLTFLIHTADNKLICPVCFQAQLEHLEGDLAAFQHLSPPEMIIPWALSPGRMGQLIDDFASGIPFSPQDLNIANLNQRIKYVYLPKWLVDVKTEASWNAEMGFNYQVVSHQERFDQNRGGWKTQQVEEQRIRWEARLGDLERFYQNIAAPALEGNTRLSKLADHSEYGSGLPYESQALGSGIVCLPNRSKQDAWKQALPALRYLAADDCRMASEADHVRQFDWSPKFDEQNWTMLLQPIATTFYLDDDQKAQPILIHGQSGQIKGIRRASMKKARRVSITILIIALVLFVAGLASLALSPILPVIVGLSAIGVAASFALALSALIPVVIVWWFNRNQEGL